MAKKNRYADWLQANQTVPGSYAELMARNEKIKNTPETVVTGYSAVPKMAQSFGAADNTDVAPTEKYDPAYAEWYAKYGTKAFTKDEYDAANGIVRNQDEFDSLYRSEDGTINGVVRDREKWNERNGVIGTYADYAKQLGVAEQKQQADAAYDRAIPTYGALAEQMAQAGIHGGYGDYLQGVAYAQMQNQKYAIDKTARESYADYTRANDKEYARQMQEATTAFKQHQHDADAGYAAYLAKTQEANDAAYQEYTVAQEAQAKADKQARDARVGSLYERFTTGGKDADGNAVDGLGLQNILDDAQYEQAVKAVKDQYKNLGYDEAEINEALKRVASMRNTQIGLQSETTAKYISAITKGEDGADDKFLSEMGYTQSAQNEGESDSDYEDRVEKEKSAAYLDALDYAVENNMLSDTQRSEAIKARLPIYSSKYKNYSESNWNDRADDLAETAISAKMLHDNGRILDSDYNQIVSDINTKLKDMKVSVEEQHGAGWDNIRIDIGNNEIIHADRYASVTESKEKELDEKFGNSPLAVEYTGETDDEGNAKYKLYYREGANRRWEQISTKSGSASGGVEKGNKMLAAIAIVMEAEYKETAPYTNYIRGGNFKFNLFSTKGSE